jgi:pyrroloquinoline quinone biosynthesis protein B
MALAMPTAGPAAAGPAPDFRTHTTVIELRVLGSGAGGGFPQWNCNCTNCRGVRTGAVNALPRTQSSVAIRGSDEFAWALVNASPDLLAQLKANPDLQPARLPRDTGIQALVLTDSQIDHTTGLLMLREATRPWPLWCTDCVFEDLSVGNPVLNVLQHYCRVIRRRIAVDGDWFAMDGLEDLRWQAIHISSNPSPYSRRRALPVPDVPGDVIGLLIEDAASHRRIFYAPALPRIEPHVWEQMQSADCVLVDGTFWSDDEMSRRGVGSKTAAQMGHLPQSGEEGMIAWLDRLPSSTRRVLIHINNTNPILVDDSAERHALTARGIEVACDGMDIVL